MRIVLCFFFWLVPQMAFAVSASVDHATVTVYYTENVDVPIFPYWAVAPLIVVLGYFIYKRRHVIQL